MLSLKVFLFSVIFTVAFAEFCYDCGDPSDLTKSIDIYAGQHYHSGTFTITALPSESNSGYTSFHVVAEGINNWEWSVIQIWIRSTTPGSNPGGFDYKYESGLDVSYFEDIITIKSQYSPLACDSPIYFSFHAESYQNIDGNHQNAQTSWALGQFDNAQGWGGYDKLDVCCDLTSCDEPECVLNSDCSDSLPCQVGLCNDGVCELTNNDDYEVQISCGDGICFNYGTETCVNGELSATCVPGIADSDDPCDGLDNDCDGETDEDFVESQTECGVGACTSTGSLQCINGEVVDSCTEGDPDAEDVCDGLDNDCDGEVDEDYVETSTTCGIGACASSGALQCINGAEVDSCEPGEPNLGDDTCDGVDNDCDGSIDEDFDSESTTCGVGACHSSGFTECIDGSVIDNCSPGNPAGNDNNCDGIDGNCNGMTDEGYSGDSTTCGVGACASTGEWICTIGGNEVDTCTPLSPPANGFENGNGVCDGIDNDCDGEVDEHYTSKTISCGEGVCKVEYESECVNGEHNEDSCVPGNPTLQFDTTCNGIDEDCDGEIDEDYVETPTTCGIGACASTGTLQCINGVVVDSCTEGNPAADDTTCNGIDEDCDGEVDEEYVETPTTCGEGACSDTGVRKCIAGNEVDTCEPGHGSDEDLCDGFDNDCDGETDEDHQIEITSCGLGVCATTGELICSSGSEVDTCVPGARNSENDATCNGLDDNCNGETDEDYTPSSTTCGLGVCSSTGSLECNNGTPQDSCVPGNPTLESDTTCNGVDEDCDGEVDEEYNPSSTTCGVGHCEASGSTVCENGQVSDNCTPGNPLSEDDSTCDGVDDNCNGQVDEDFEETETTCGEGACASTGIRKCINGQIVDTCDELDPEDGLDLCDGVDNDCDGRIDEDHVRTSTECGIGACASTGELICVNGQIVDTCSPSSPASSDPCDGIDNNCNGVTDEDFVEETITCGKGVCRRSVVVECIEGELTNSECAPGGPTGLDNDCDGLDNDCDGEVDEHYVRTTTTCGEGICSNEGELRCINGQEVDTCDILDPTSNDSSCNGIDENCNGVADENYVRVNTECGVGACRVDFTSECIDGEETECIPGQPLSADDATCDGVDDNCNGQVDENATCNDNIACTVESCTPNGCEYDTTLCDEPCHSCEVITQAIVTTQMSEAGVVSFTYAGEDYIFDISVNEQWILQEVNIVVTANDEDFDSTYDFSEDAFNFENINAQEFETRVESPTTCGEEHVIAVIIRVERISNGESVLAYALGNYQPEEFNFPIITYHRACCNPSACVACHVDSDCPRNNSPCFLVQCINNECSSENVCAGPVEGGEVEEPVVPPEQPASPIPPQEPVAPVPAPVPAGEVIAPAGDAGAAPIANEAADVVAGSSSTIVVGGVGAAFVGFFAFFAAAVGLNTTKQDASEPLAAMLEESEAGTSAFINPTFVDGAGAQNNVMGV